MKPTIQDAIRLIADTYGLTFAEATALLRTPLHPHGLRDEFAGLAMQGTMAGILGDGGDWPVKRAIVLFMGSAHGAAKLEK